MGFISAEVKGLLGLSFWRACALAVAVTSVSASVLAQETFSILVAKESELLRDARALSVAPDGSLYIADTGHHRILQFGPDGALLGEIGGLGREHGQFQWPIDVASEHGTSIWVSDFGNRRIERFTRRFTYQGTIELPSSSGDVAGQPGMLATTAAGDLFVIEQDGQRLLKFNPLGILQAEFTSHKGTGWVSAAKSLAAQSDFGVVWVDEEANLIRHMDVFANPLSDLGRGQLHSPQLVALGEKALWVCDSAGIKRAEIEQGEFQLVLEMRAMHKRGIQQVSDFTHRGDSLLYLLDGHEGQLWRVALRPK